MKTLHIDFAPPSLARTLAEIGALTWLIVLFATIALIAGGFTLQALSKQHALQQMQLRTLLQEQQRATAVAATKAPVLPIAKVLAVNAVIEQLNLPWRDLLNAIEQATPARIALVSVEPDARKHSLKGVAEASDSEAMIGYIALLEGQALFSKVVLMRHDTNEQHPRKPVRFQFEAHWSGGAP
jgi:Tfp pilus assembly protein PilN